MKKLFIVVLYKMGIEDSPTVQSFIKCNLFANSDNSFYFWDNSPAPSFDENIKYSERLGKNVVYSSHTENTPLAKVYNTIIAEYSDVDYVSIFDQDTKINSLDYENVLDKALEENKLINLFMPIIKTANGQIYSPGKNILPGKNRKIKKLPYGVFPARKMVGITSGLVISTKYLTNQYKFNEKLKLYGVDTDFFYHYEKSNKYLYLLKVDIDHDLSFESSEISAEENWLRFIERNAAYFDIYTSLIERLFVHVWLAYYRIIKKLNLLRYK
jgi:hypothetical protein